MQTSCTCENTPEYLHNNCTNLKYKKKHWDKFLSISILEFGELITMYILNENKWNITLLLQKKKLIEKLKIQFYEVNSLLLYVSIITLFLRKNL